MVSSYITSIATLYGKDGSINGLTIMPISRFIDCRNLTFSSRLARDRMQRAQQALGQNVVQRMLCFSLFLLGLNRAAIAQALKIPAETAKSIIKAVNRDGICALEDRRHRISSFLPPCPTQAEPITLEADDEHLVVDFGVEQPRLELPRHNEVQVRTVLLSMLNSGLLSKEQVADVIGLTPAHTLTLAKRLEQQDISVLIDKRQGQKIEYRITADVKAELIQQFTVDVMARGNTSGQAISEELQERCQITIPARTVRHHLARMGLPSIKHSLPELFAAVKKTSRRSS